MRTFFGIVIILLTSSVFWLSHLWITTRKDEEALRPEPLKKKTPREPLRQKQTKKSSQREQAIG